MTTFIAALHLPYTVFLSEDSDNGTSKAQTRPLKPVSRGDAEASHVTSYTTQLPLTQIEAAHPIPFDSGTPMPNLLNALGHYAMDSSTPLLTPRPLATPNEELFFSIQKSEDLPQILTGDGSTRRVIGGSITHVKQVSDGFSMNKLAKEQVDDTGYFPVAVRSIDSGRRTPMTPEKSSQTDIFRDDDWAIEATNYGNGGLKNAVSAAAAAGHPREIVCVGTLGFGGSSLNESRKIGIEGRLRDEFNCLVAFLDNEDFDGHYHHYCKEVLWPVFHYQIPDHPKSKAFLDHSWKYFEAVNRAVADVIIKDYKREDNIWINDYHLLLVPQILRDALGPDAKIGFFLHVGFPSSEVFRCLAHRERLLEGVLGSTIIGFQTDEYARHFLTTCSRLLNVEARNDGIMLESRFVKSITLPIGIDPLQLDEKRAELKVLEWGEALKARYVGKKLLVARDKLDGVRGVRQKLLAYELFLNKNPEWVGKVVLVQVALTTTSIVELQSTVIDIVTRINCAYSTLEYQPVIYLHQDITYHQYVALLQHADTLMVTSLRDGMNLTSHEFIYLQNKKHSPLILSEFTGSSSVFGGAELSVNPWDYSKCAEAILQALTMSDNEKSKRWQKLHDAVVNRNASQWFSQFLLELDNFWEENQRRESTMIPRLSTKGLAEKYEKSKRRIFLLDYEGTLVSWGSPHSNIITSPQRILDIINDLLMDNSNIVYIMSSRSKKDLEQVFHRVPRVGLLAEGGAYFRLFDNSLWTRLADENLKWKPSVKEILQYYVERTPGTYIEERDCSYIWHHEKAEDKIYIARQLGDCCSHVNDSCESLRVHAIPLSGGVLVESKDVNKTMACKKIMSITKESIPSVDFLMIAGDRRDDEAVFEWASNLAKEQSIQYVTTIRVGVGHTQANTTTPGVSGVVSALKKLAAMAVERL